MLPHMNKTLRTNKTSTHRSSNGVTLLQKYELNSETSKKHRDA